ncbi:MAG: gliding motility-associated C-terminal domain-containing protein [Chitinophagaceae bacterium]|nr:gliding motility-associated C-terminal domain-containing protein [Chitinophagaceae bacterium]
MNKRFSTFKKMLIPVAGCCFMLTATDALAQKNSGIFYTTIFAKTSPYKRVSAWGANADNYFLKDVNGDGKDDAVIYTKTGKWQAAFSDGVNFVNPTDLLSYTSPSTPVAQLKPLMGDLNGDKKQDAVFFDPVTGNWLVALSDGTSFQAPAQWSTGNGVGSTKQFLADVNGDGKDDAVIYFHTGLDGYWYIGLNTGNGSFSGFSPWIQNFGNTADDHFMADVNGDGKVDAIIMERSTGTWKVALSNGAQLTNPGVWRTGFGISNENGIVADVDRDGKADIVYYKDTDWWVAYSSGSSFDANHRWVAGNRPATIISRSNRPVPKAKLVGSVSGATAVACAISAGDWLALENANKGATVSAYEADTWDAWGNPYTPQLPGHTATYDAGDAAVNDQQIKMIHDAGFTYIMLDITNGANAWVDNRAKKFIERIQYWNSHLNGNQHKMYFCISMGGSRGMAAQQASDRVELESKRTWDEFYEPYQDAYYIMKGKPLLIHFVEYPVNKDGVLQYTSQMPNFQKFTVRWMYNEIKDQPVYANAYGWPILEKNGNPAGDEVMDVSPGFWNSLVYANREKGELYRNQWMRVLQNSPASVWLNSFNETWEHTSVEPSYINPEVAAAVPDILSVWSDYYGERMDDFYWVMTKQYNRLFMNRELFRNSYLQEQGSNDIYQVKDNGLQKSGTAKPHMSPVLLVPKNFISNFSGNVIDENLQVTGKIESTGTGGSQQNIKVAANVLSPNGDGKNDYWIVKDIEQFPGNTVKVFDNKGRLVFQKKNYTNDWNGNYWGGSSHGKPVPQGTYLYVIDFGNGKVSKGYLSVVR